MASDPNKLFFSGTAYLGMPFNEDFRKLVFEGMELYGINHGASRNNNITLDIFSEAEKVAAKRFLSDDSILVSSGYLAAQLVIQHYHGSHQFLYAPESHPALYFGAPLISKTKYTDWVEQAIKEINSAKKPILIISNALNNLTPEIFDFAWLSRIDLEREVVVLVDDSHGVGIMGEKGEGTYSKIPELPNIQKIVISSMAKALGIDAGLILANSALINKLRTSPVYAGSSPPSPGILYAFVHSEHTYNQELIKLRKNINNFIAMLTIGDGMFFIKDFPVFLVENQALAEGILTKGIHISSFPYPDPQGKKLNRIVLSSVHKMGELEILADTINILNSRNF
ncbi:aminotransferase class I/II-fold pyridoxal phosphate-dependent enzyme [Daejeonella sp.]|jgi:8-amino-7-oxononanoate synthase|uniref:aminotransferase class I/II-fold pyridoxal phosphate-dependent enzyme n=1 Tax=Daejeonella sp. TaxID=2805397 RepID=UPI003784835A